MCGIAGAIGSAFERSVVEGLLARLRHRGPDDSGLAELPGVVLGATRLAIRDGAHATQPWQTPDKRFTLVWNGELYNADELRRDLEGLGATFRTFGDTEVLGKALAHWGEDALNQLNGMFALAWWDARQRRGFLARDMFGQKPLYYAVPCRKGLLFSSEMRPLIASGLISKDINVDALCEFLRFPAILAPRTILRDIRSLEPGHLLRLHHEKQTATSSERWYRSTPRHEFAASDAELIDQGARLLERVVQRHLTADQGTGVFLSSGVDSSCLAALCKGKPDSADLAVSISIDEPSTASLDEGHFAGQTARSLGLRHVRECISAEDFGQMYPQILAAMDHPTGDGVNTAFLCSRAARHGRVFLSGAGADELLGGYSWCWQLPASARSWSPQAAARRYRHLGARHVLPLQGAEYLDYFRSSRQVYAERELPKLLAKPPTPRLFPHLVGADLAMLSFEEQTLRSLQAVELPGLFLPDIDQMSMANSIEVRVPYLDREWVEFCACLPLSAKIRGHQGKWILRQIAARLLGPEFLERPKQGFHFPLLAWMWDKKGAWVEDVLSSPRLKARGLLRSEFVRQVMEESRHEVALASHPRLLNLITLEIWMRINLDNDAPF